jgi:hypothetical protein
MKCPAIVDQICLLEHSFSVKCHEKDTKTCPKCKAEMEAAEKKRQRDYELEQERLVRQRDYAAQLAELDDEIAHEKRLLRNASEDKDRQNVLSQKQQDLESLRDQIRNPQKTTATLPSTASDSTVPDSLNESEVSQRSKSKQPHQAAVSSPPAPIADTQSDDDASVRSDDSGASSSRSSASQSPIHQHSLPALAQSEAQDDWEWQKTFQGARNVSLDALIAMIGKIYLILSEHPMLTFRLGLESVKQKFLGIKAKVDTQVRQNVSLKGERFGAALLGNPGTGAENGPSMLLRITDNSRQDYGGTPLRQIPAECRCPSWRFFFRNLRI